MTSGTYRAIIIDTKEAEGEDPFMLGESPSTLIRIPIPEAVPVLTFLVKLLIFLKNKVFSGAVNGAAVITTPCILNGMAP